MKKISIIVMALAFLAALTQCKKEQVTPANDSEGVAITLDLTLTVYEMRFYDMLIICLL